MSDKKINVMLFGLGAIGGFYAFILSRNENVSLTVVARSNYEAVKKNGLKIQSANHGDHTIRPDEVIAQPSDSSTRPFDFIVITSKAINPTAIPPLFTPLVAATTTFVLIQNGVGNEEPFRTTYPATTILSCVTWVGAGQPSPGTIHHAASEDTQIGLFPNATLDKAAEQARLDTFVTLLKTGGTNVRVEPDIQVARWEKVTWNAAWNPLTTLTGASTAAWLSSSPEALLTTRALMADVIAVARASGVPLRDGLADELIEKVKGLGPIYSSMYVDSRAGRALEVDVILGFPMRRAREEGLSVPTLRAVFAMVTAVDGRLRTEGKPLA